ncbi:MAG: MFS transporter [Anaerolineales bacterium]|nr:MFS transporter [Anaerolineales bacterium]
MDNTIKQPEPSLMTIRMDRRRWIALGILSMGLMLSVIDTTIVNIAFPSIQEAYHASFSEAEWVNSIYSLIFGAALITWGKLSDQYGRRAIFVIGAALFALSSLGAGLAPTIGIMIGFRALQGLAGAMMSPSTLSIISATFKGRERGVAFGIWGATAGVSAALGPILGGWLIEYGTSVMAESWRLAFLVNVPLAAIAIAGSFWAIRESKDRLKTHHVDWLGIIFATLGLGALVAGTIEGQTYGWLYAKKVFTLGAFQYPNLFPDSAIPVGTLSFVPFLFALGLIFVALFIGWEARLEKRGGEPLFELGLFKYSSFRFGLITIFIIALGEFGVLLVVSIYLQIAKGLGAFETGVQFLSFALVNMLVAPMAGALSGRFGAKWVVTVGMLCEAIGLFWISRILHMESPISSLILPFMLYGAGVGLAIAQLSNLVLSDIPNDKAGQASGATNTVRQLGASLGIAILGAVLFTGFAFVATPLVQKSTAFEDFGQRIAQNSALSPAALQIGQGLANYGEQAKAEIVQGLQANEGFDAQKTDILQMALDHMPPAAIAALKKQNIDLANAQTVAQIKTELAPDLKILETDLQTALGTGFAQAARAASTLAALFVLCGALSSLMLPNSKPNPHVEIIAAH